MLHEILKMRVIELYHNFHQNPQYLVKKNAPRKYQLVNLTMELNQILQFTLFADEFSEKFAYCTISSLIKFFSSYNQVKLKEKSRDLTVFITFLGYMRMTNLLQIATSSIVQFFQIVFKISVLFCGTEPSHF